MLNAKEAGRISSENKKRKALSAKRNEIARKRKEALAAKKQQEEWEKELCNDYECGIAAQINKGNKSFKKVIGSTGKDLSIKDFLAEDEDTPILKKIWRSLRAKGYKVRILKHAEYYDGKSYYEGIPDSDPYWRYTYTAKVSW